MWAKLVLKWCDKCKKLVDVTETWDFCPNCNTPTPMSPHKDMGY